VETPNPTEISYLTGVAPISATDVWAVGYAAEGLEATPMVEHWNGSVWEVVDSPGITGAYNQVTGAAANSAGDVAAVGSVHLHHSDFAPLIEEWDGVAWAEVPAPEPQGTDYNYLFGISPDGAGGYWAVGQSYIASPLSFKTYILRRSP
jgi:hypothetical protein